MNYASLLQYGLLALVLIGLWRPVGGYMARVFEGQRTWLDALLRLIEPSIYRLTGVDPQTEMNWGRVHCRRLGGLGAQAGKVRG